MIDRTTLMVFDWETSGALPEYALQAWRVAQGLAWGTSLVWVNCASGTPDVKGDVLASDALPQDEVHARCAKAARAMMVEALDRKMVLGGWNTAFDIQWLLAYGCEDLVKRATFVDGMLLWRAWAVEPEYDTDRAKRKPYGLKDFVREQLPHLAGYEADADFHDASVEARALLHRYNVRDCLATYAGIRILWERLNPRQRTVAKIEASCLPLVAEANLRGLPVDTLATHELQATLRQTAAECLKALSPFGVTEKVVRSPVQLSTLLYDQWGLPVLKENIGKKTKKVSRATDKEVLHELAFIDSRARTLHNYREALGNCVKFADNILESVDYNADGCTHPQTIVSSTYTSRMTVSSKQGRNKDERQIGFALHQEKGRAEGKFYRAAIVPPPGYDLLEADAANQEFRWMAIESGDEHMLQLCLPGEDAHSFMGASIAHKDYRTFQQMVVEANAEAEHERKLGKLTNLSCQYRISARKLLVKARVEYGLDMQLQEATRLHMTYPRTYPGVPEYWRTQVMVGKAKGYVENLAGRRVRLVGDWTGPQAWKLESTTINYPIQSIGGDQKYLALSVLRPYLTKIGGYFAFDLHDGEYFFVPKAKTKTAARDIKALLDHLPYKRAWGFEPPVPLPWDVKTGASWGALKAWKGE